MSLHLVENDITMMEVDAIVNSTNHHMIGFSGVDRILHDLGGEEFEKECSALRNVCVPGEAVYTNAYNIPCKYVIHTVSPGWFGGIKGEAAVLRSCYKSSLELAENLGCQSVAFPLISAGSMGFPIAPALANAVKTIREYLELYSDMEVYLVLHGAVVTEIAETMFGDLDKYVAETLTVAEKEPELDLKAMLDEQHESFVDMLYRFMDEKGVQKASQLYSKAGITKGAFSKLISGSSKRPSIETAVGLAMALELTYDETVAFLASAGIALSNSSKFDIIVSYFIKSGNYDIWQLDVQLVKYGYKSLLGEE